MERYRYKMGDEDYRVSYEIVVKLTIAAGTETIQEQGRLIYSDPDDLDAEMYLDAHLTVRNSINAVKKNLAEWQETNPALGIKELEAKGA